MLRCPRSNAGTNSPSPAALTVERSSRRVGGTQSCSPQADGGGGDDVLFCPLAHPHLSSRTLPLALSLLPPARLRHSRRGCPAVRRTAMQCRCCWRKVEPRAVPGARLARGGATAQNPPRSTDRAGDGTVQLTPAPPTERCCCASRPTLAPPPRAEPLFVVFHFLLLRSGAGDIVTRQALARSLPPPPRPLASAGQWGAGLGQPSGPAAASLALGERTGGRAFAIQTQVRAGRGSLFTVPSKRSRPRGM